MPALSPRPHPVVSLSAALFALAPASMAQWTAIPNPGDAPSFVGPAAVVTGADNMLALGLGSASGQSEFWRFLGVEWLQLQPMAGPPRAGMAMAFDAARGHLVAFGGVANPTTGPVLFQDTWIFAGSAWRQALPANSPPPRSGAAMAYDARRQRIVLFGGESANGPTGDTFEWDGTDWQQRSPQASPPATAVAMAYDAARQEVGLLLDGAPSYWTYDGDDWRQSAGPAPVLVAPRLAFDAARGRLVAHGLHPLSALPETWEDDGGGWRVAPQPGASVVGDALLAYDPVQQAVVLTTAGTCSAWLPEPIAGAVSFGTSCSPALRRLTPATGSLPALGRLLRMNVNRSGSGDLAFGILGTSRTSFGGVPLPTPVPLPASGGCSLRVDFFSGTILPAADPAPWVVPVPNSSVLLGAEMQAQVLFVDTLLRATDSTNGLALRAGLPPDVDSRLVETFADFLRRDLVASGDRWNGRVQSVGLGGDGRHGSFDPTVGTQVAPNTYEFQTDGMVIPGRLTLSGEPETVATGEFFFTDFLVPAGVTVRFRGANAAIVRVRGQVRIAGVVDADAAPMTGFLCRNQTPAQGNLPVAGQPGGVGGPGGGRGGAGGDRGLNTGPGVAFDGKDGQSVQLAAGHAYAALAVGTGGRGSAMFPAHGTTAGLTGTFTLQNIFNGSYGLGGGGGGHTVAGGSSSNSSTNPAILPGPATAGGIAFALLPLPPGRSSLEHFLVGGSGGGGGGSHPFVGLSIAVAQFQNDVWKAGAGGSGGGGAIALRCGSDLLVQPSGQVRARGGAGALLNGDNPATPAFDVTTSPSSWGAPQPGGGGSGGSVLLQAGGGLLALGGVDTSGGAGSGSNATSISGSVLTGAVVQAGAGSAGALRFESLGQQFVGGPTVPAFTPAVHSGALVDRDRVSGSRSLWYVPGTLDLPYYRAYELTVDLDGQTFVFSDDPAIGPPADGNGPVRVRFQSARLRPDGTLDEASIGPWRDYVGSKQDGFGLGHDRGDAFRFDLVIDSTLGGNPTVRQLVVRYR